MVLVSACCHIRWRTRIQYKMWIVLKGINEYQGISKVVTNPIKHNVNGVQQYKDKV